MNPFASAAFMTSVAKLADLPPEGAPEIAFAGRSNVGKSSALNALAGRKRLAYFSKTPGRTQTLNFFSVGEDAVLVDLPGYGYAKVPDAVRQEWDQLAGGYLASRSTLVGVVIIMDARHPFKPHDVHLIDWLRPVGVRVLALLSKCDKLTRRDAAAVLKLAQSRVGEAILFSSVDRTGVEETRARLLEWLSAEDKRNPR
ncbi:MAG: ribosome biogenesis GTP-binding protein YihA/YsxC [Burkholderiales bacterium]